MLLSLGGAMSLPCGAAGAQSFFLSVNGSVGGDCGSLRSLVGVGEVVFDLVSPFLAKR